MEIKDVLSLDAVFCVSDGAISKQDLLKRIARIAADAYGIDFEISYEGLLERERASSTGLGQGIALPHARSSHFPMVIGTFARLSEPIDFKAPDRLPVDLVFGIFAPIGESVEYLKLLSSVARTLRQADVRRKLRSTDSAEGLHLVLTENGD